MDKFDYFQAELEDFHKLKRAWVRKAPGSYRCVTRYDRNGEEYDRDGSQMRDLGLYVDLENWNCHLLRFFKQDSGS